MIILYIGVMVSLLGILIFYLYKKVSISFDLIFNKLHIDADFWGSDKDV